jgi:phosphatidylglycerol:prolipoprotein diacylglycerol transferase
VAPAIHLFGISLQTYPLAILAAVALAVWLAARAALRTGVDEGRIDDLGTYALLATALGARLVYAATHWGAYRATPLAVFSLSLTALSWPGGAVFGLLVGALYGWRRKLPLGPTLDALAPGIALGLAVERLGAFLGGVGLGAPTTLPWGVPVLGVPRHPVQLVEAAFLLGITVLLWVRLERRRFAGQGFLHFIALYAGQRLFLEAFRAQTPLLPDGVRLVQVIALAALLGATGYLYYRHFTRSAVHVDRPDR